MCTPVEVLFFFCLPFSLSFSVSVSFPHTNTHVFRHFHVVFVWQCSCSLRCSHILSHISCCATISDVYVCVCERVPAQSKARQSRRDKPIRDVFIYGRVISRAYVLFCVRTETIPRSWIVVGSPAFSMLRLSAR